MIDQISLRYSKKKMAFNDGGNHRHGLKNVACKQTFMP